MQGQEPESQVLPGCQPGLHEPVLCSGSTVFPGHTGAAHLKQGLVQGPAKVFQTLGAFAAAAILATNPGGAASDNMQHGRQAPPEHTCDTQALHTPRTM